MRKDTERFNTSACKRPYRGVYDSVETLVLRLKKHIQDGKTVVAFMGSLLEHVRSNRGGRGGYESGVRNRGGLVPGVIRRGPVPQRKRLGQHHSNHRSRNVADESADRNELA